MLVSRNNANPPHVMIKTNESEHVTDLRKTDVLLGRGTGPNEHQGNRSFRDEVSLRKDEYDATLGRLEKTKIIKKTIKVIKAKGGRFIKKVKRIGPRKVRRQKGGDRVAYEIVDDSTVISKTKQAFRYCQSRMESPTERSSRNNSGIVGTNKSQNRSESVSGRSDVAGLHLAPSAGEPLEQKEAAEVKTTSSQHLGSSSHILLPSTLRREQQLAQQAEILAGGARAARGQSSATTLFPLRHPASHVETAATTLLARREDQFAMERLNSLQNDLSSELQRYASAATAVRREPQDVALWPYNALSEQLSATALRNHAARLSVQGLSTRGVSTPTRSLSNYTFLDPTLPPISQYRLPGVFDSFLSQQSLLIHPGVADLGLDSAWANSLLTGDRGGSAAFHTIPPARSILTAQAEETSSTHLSGLGSVLREAVIRASLRDHRRGCRFEHDA